MPHEYKIQWITVKLVWDFLYAKCVCHPCADLAKLETEKHCSQCETQICSTEELPQTLMHSARTRRTHANARGVLLEAAFSFFLGRGKIKLHQHAESQLIFPNPKTVDILQSARVKTYATGKTKRLKNTELTQSKTNIYTIAYMWKHGIWGSRASVPQIKPRIRKKRHSPNKKPNWPWKLEHDITAACGSLLFTS